MYLRLPPYMCDLNTIELAWAQVKRKIREKNITSNLSNSELELLTGQAISDVTPAAWKNFCGYVEKIEQEYWSKDNLIENMMETQGSESEESDEPHEFNESADSDDSTSSEDL